MDTRATIFALLIILAPILHAAQGFQTPYPTVPRIDANIHKIHSHGVEGFRSYLKLRDTLNATTNVDLALWIDHQQNDPDSMRHYTGSRMMGTTAQRRPATDGITHTTDADLDSLAAKGYLGISLWSPPHPRQTPGPALYRHLDDSAHIEPLANITHHKLLLANLYIADPLYHTPPEEHSLAPAPEASRPTTPIDFWREINALQRILDREPQLKVIVSHGAWLMDTPQHLEYLSYLLAYYPQLNIDLSLTLPTLAKLPSQELRQFFTTFQDRLLFGTDLDLSPITDLQSMNSCYTDWFRYLETHSSFTPAYHTSIASLHGIGLPRPILEKIYFKNAIRIYPIELLENMLRVGYAISKPKHIKRSPR